MFYPNYWIRLCHLRRVAMATGTYLARIYSRIAEDPATRMSGAEVRGVVGSISKIKIGEAHQDFEKTPSEPILPPQPSGIYEVDESVRGCRLGLSSVTGRQ